MASSINQNAYSGALPNFRNLGIMARILVIVNMLAVAAAIVKSADARAAWGQFIEIAALVEPLLVLSLFVLAMLSFPIEISDEAVRALDGQTQPLGWLLWPRLRLCSCRGLGCSATRFGC